MRREGATRRHTQCAAEVRAAREASRAPTGANEPGCLSVGCGSWNLNVESADLCAPEAAAVRWESDIPLASRPLAASDARHSCEL